VDAASLRLAEQYIGAFGNIAQKTNTMLLPAASSDVSGMVAQAVGIFRGLQRGSVMAGPEAAPAADILSQSAASLGK
jgi:hypothetical protein